MLDEMTVWIFRVVASLLCACFFFAATVKSVGVMQQAGYGNRRFLAWLKKDRNTYFSRLLFWSILSVTATALFIFVFYFLQEVAAMAMGGIPFFGFSILFCVMDRGYALKVQAVKSGRWRRLAIVYCLLIAVASFGLICACSLLDSLLEMVYSWMRVIRFLPLCFMPVLLPYLLVASNAILSPLEEKRNRKFVKRAGQVLNESKAIKVGIVGSYGKTSVKNILKTALSEKYRTVATPASYNTPIGVAKAVFSDEFAPAEIFLCEMGARKAGDIRELCELVQPDYIVFTGVCAQHVQTFGSEDGVFSAKCEALFSSAKTIVCGRGLQERIEQQYPDRMDVCRFVGEVKDLVLRADETELTLPLQSGDVRVTTKLLGDAAAENILLAATLCELLGLSKEEIEAGMRRLIPVPHRLELTENNGVYILDDAYNCNVKGAKIAIDALKRFAGKKYIVTPGIVETGVLDKEINGELGALLAGAGLDLTVLVGETQAKVIVEAYKNAGGDEAALKVVPSLADATKLLQGRLLAGDCVLFMNDLPDVV